MSSAEETLKKQLPRYFRPIMEFGEILKAQGYSLDQFDGDSARVYANNYIATCDEDTITYYERLLGIAYRFGDTLEYRRTRVLLSASYGINLQNYTGKMAMRCPLILQHAN